MDKKEFYEQRARQYGSFDRQGQKRYERALKLAEIKNGDRILDVGCKDACLCDMLAEKNVACEYYGIDISQQVIDSIKGKKGSFQRCDVMNGLPFQDGYFDRIFCLELLEHVENPTFLLKEFYRVLKSDGVLVLSVPNPYNWILVFANMMKLPAGEGHIHSFTFQDLVTLLGFVGFGIRKRLGTYTIVPYTLHGVKNGRYFMFASNWLFLAASFIYRIEKV